MYSAFMKRILVTGGAGFIGSNFVNLIWQNKIRGFENIKLMVLDSLSYASNIDNIEKCIGNRIEFLQGDILDRNLVMSLVSKVDGVINLAAESHVDRSIDNPEVFLASNIIGASNIFAACEVFKKRILQVSTDEVYGSIASGFADESHQLDPSSPYSSSKASADLIGLAFHKTYGLDIVITRCGNNYGCNQYPEKLIPLFIKNLSTGKNVPLYGDGTNSRDWVHVEDHCNGIALAFLNGKSGNVYNIGNVDHLSNLQVTQEILDAMGLGWNRVETVKDRPGHDWRYAISSNKIKRELNWVPKKNFRAELPSLINFYSL